MKTAVIGSGSIVPDFMEAMAQIPELEAYAIYGREKSIGKLTEMKERYGFSRIYHDYDALLSDPEVCVVYIALPNHLHYEYTKRAILAGKHVITEKPFASTLAQAKELAALAEQKHVMVFEAISNQYMPNYRKTKELLEQLGDVKIVQLNFSQYSRRYDKFKAGEVLPVFDPKQAGGAMMDLNVYNVHYVTGLFGKPERVHYLANVERGIDTSGILTMEYPRMQGVCIGAKDCKAPLSINIQGDKGFIHSDSAANSYGSFQFGTNDGTIEAFALNEGRPRLYFELREFTDLVLAEDAAKRKEYMEHTLIVQEILDEARRQVGITLGGVCDLADACKDKGKRIKIN